MKKPKTSADYQREYRKRLRDQGLVKKEVWIHPNHARILSQYEQVFRNPLITSGKTCNTQLKEIEVSMNKKNTWTTHSLFEALLETEMVSSNQASIKLEESTKATIHMVLHSMGDLPVYVTVAGEQILAESLLWPQDMVNDVVAFNDEVLVTHKIFPLSTISLDTLPTGERYYTMFGALSAFSSLFDVVFEIELLADNVIKAADAYSKFLPSQMMVEV
ncbi:YjfI family protein [Nitrincola iocasae]|jgi:uncharacterized protein YjfI (DUF2170 family)|uniref:DUF2170 family protein n=1 Tax=Nitrincola iocasae TaxID=2614693 RepID=A0A5J6LI97_9GAMM|nr:YjfI family protein [Nitrincola iocasae]QEW08032.1 DUF2170 family protein [Nitrincola iocasae]